jgi:hypothetical protein
MTLPNAVLDGLEGFVAAHRRAEDAQRQREAQPAASARRAELAAAGPTHAIRAPYALLQFRSRLDGSGDRRAGPLRGRCQMRA